MPTLYDGLFPDGTLVTRATRRKPDSGHASGAPIAPAQETPGKDGDTAR